MRNSLRWSVWGAVLTAGLFGCSSHSKSQTAPTLPPVTSSAAPPASSSTPDCPVAQIQGTDVVTSDTTDGVAMVFTTRGDVSELRTQVRELADLHNGTASKSSSGRADRDVQGGMPGSQDSSGATPSTAGNHPVANGGPSPSVPTPEDGIPDPRGVSPGEDMHGTEAGMQQIPSRASTEDIPSGERLVLVPDDPSQLPALRAQAREHVAMIERGECPWKGAETAPTGDQGQPTSEPLPQHQPAGTR